MAGKRLRKGRLFIVSAAVVLSMVVVDSVRRDFFRVNTNNAVTVEGEFKTKNSGLSSDPTRPFTLGNEEQPVTAFEGVENIGYTEISIPASKLSQGLLVLTDEEHPAPAAAKGSTVDLLKSKNEYYTLIEEGVRLNSDAAEALNMMMADYHEATALSDFIVYGTTDTYTDIGSYCPRHFDESVTGYTVDLALNGYGTVLTFDGYDEEGWVVENCYKYGFIVRYPLGKEEVTGEEFCPWHLRYVGELNAEVMHDRDLCLEEYIDLVKEHTYSDPLKFDLAGSSYEIYGAPSAGDSTPVRVPVAGNYAIYGNNIDGFIVAAKK